MSIFYSKFGLNAYANTPYFQAHLPEGYDIDRTLIESKAFRRLPANLRELATLAKRWAARKDGGILNIDRWYDADGYELDPDTGRRLTDAEIDAEWHLDPGRKPFKIEDVLLPPSGFPNPDGWEPSPEPESPGEEEPTPTREQLLSWIASHGVERVVADYGAIVSKLLSVSDIRKAVEDRESSMAVNAASEVVHNAQELLANERIGDSYFARCARDDKGHCLSGDGVKVATTEELKKARDLAKRKAANNPKPTAEEKAEAIAGIAKKGANKYRRDLVGNSKGRAKRKAQLLKEFGDGTSCPCVYCGVKLGDGEGHTELEQDKILTTAQGGRYRMPNIIPSCGSCNKGRGDVPWKKVVLPKEGS